MNEDEISDDLDSTIRDDRSKSTSTSKSTSWQSTSSTFELQGRNYEPKMKEEQ